VYCLFVSMKLITELSILPRPGDSILAVTFLDLLSIELLLGKKEVSVLSMSIWV